MCPDLSQENNSILVQHKNTPKLRFGKKTHI